MITRIDRRYPTTLQICLIVMAFALVMFDSPPTLRAACCLPSGQCTSTTEQDCTAQGGFFVGENVNCSTANCVRGACCNFVENVCEITSAAECRGDATHFLGAGTTCENVSCGEAQEENGACCQITGDCVNDVSKFSCESGLNGVFQGGGTICQGRACPGVTGACCLPQPTGACASLTLDECRRASDGVINVIGEGVFMGANVECNEALCNNLGPVKCCVVSGFCIDVASEEVCTSLGGREVECCAECSSESCDDDDDEGILFGGNFLEALTSACLGTSTMALTLYFAGFWFMLRRHRRWVAQESENTQSRVDGPERLH
ncbi:MAG: hypothetical protein MI923_28845 [Phycisphaerales bacterium]|nr:hypothetical protein [Phycisphaerales bacterium]